MHEVHESADRRKNRADEVRKEFCHLDVDSEHVRALLVSADSVEVASELCPSEHKEKNHDHKKRNKNTRLHIGRNIFSDLVHRAHARNVYSCFYELYESLMLYVELSRVYDCRHSFCEEHSRKRDDERLDVEERHKESLHKSEAYSDNQRVDYRSRNCSAVFVQMNRAAHTDESRYSSNGNVDSAGNHYKAQRA